MKNKNKRKLLLIVMPYLLKPGDIKSSKLRSFKAFPYGLLSLATYLKRNSKNEIDVEILDCNSNNQDDYIPFLKNKLNKFKPDIIGLSMMFDNSYNYIKDMTDVIREYDKNSIILMGGSAATSSYQDIMKEQNNIDAICFYEGELPFLEMIKSENIMEFLENDVAWITKKSLAEGRVPQKKSIENLDDVVDIDYDFIDIADYGMQEAFSPLSGKIEPGKQFFLVTSRGCPFKCAFCMRSADKDKSMRYASPEKIIEHVRFLVSKYGMKVLTIYDDQILLNKNRAKIIFKELAQFNLRIECPNGLSVAFMDEEMIMLMRKAGMDTVNLAIESGSPRVLYDIIHKPLRLEMVKPVVDILRKYKFWIHGFFVTGIPGETDEDRDMTVKFIKDVGLDWSGFSLLMPTMGSELFNICKENGYITGSTKIGELDYNKYIINTPDYTADHVIKKAYLMNLDVNFVNNWRMKHGDYKIASDAFRDVIKRYKNHAFAYYYLSKAKAALNEKEEAEIAMNKYREIVSNDSTWGEYVKYFNIE